MKTYRKNWASFAVLVVGILLGGLWLFHPTRAAGPWYVTPGGDDTNDCLTPATPCETINGAIGKATAGDTVYVATGIYTNITSSQVVLIDQNIFLSGGWSTNFVSQIGLSTLDGENVRRGMMIENGVFATVERFMFENGFSDGGSGLSNAGTLTLTDSILQNNVANVGIACTAGGGISNSTTGVLTLNNSMVNNNTVYGYGGGLSNGGTVTVTHTTISGNEAISCDGGGVSNFGSGTATFLNSTISGNTTTSHGGGIFNPQATVFLSNTTIFGNVASGDGGGIYNNSGPVTIKNSILAGNTASGFGTECYLNIISDGYNLIQNPTSCVITGNTTGNLTGVSPNLDALQDNGGPTLTHALLPGSPAIDAGNPATPGSGGNACEPTDQRGVTRPQLSACDIGAFELESSSPIVKFSNSPYSVNEDASTALITVTASSNLTQTATVDYSTSDGTATAGEDYLSVTGTFTFTPSTLVQTFTVTITDDFLLEGNETVLLALTNPVNIVLGTPNSTVLTIVEDEPFPVAQFSQSFFNADENTATASLTVTLDMASPLTATLDYSTQDGTATAGDDYFPAFGTLTFPPGVQAQTLPVTLLEDAIDEADETITVTLSNPTNAVLGFPDSATLTIVDNDLPPVPGPRYVTPTGDDHADCQTPATACETINGALLLVVAGDTIYVAEGLYTNTVGSEVVLINKEITLSGGWNESFTTQDGLSTIDGQGMRRGITVSHEGTTAIEHFQIQNGWTEGDGGGIYNIYASILTLSHCAVDNNTSVYYGGGIQNDGTLTLFDSIISNNHAQTGNGGGISNNGTLSLSSSSLNGNHASSNGGGIYNSYGGLVTVDGSNFANNSAESGGGLTNVTSGSVTITTTEFLNNGASNSGGAISNNGTLSIAQSTFSANNGYIGGALYNFDGSLTISGTTFFINSAMSGGGIYSSGNFGTATVSNSTFSSNHSVDQGGGISNSMTFLLSNSTLYANSSEGTAGGLFSSPANPMLLQNTILAGNTSAGGSPDCSGTVNSQGYNLIQETSGCTLEGDTTGNLTGVDPNLGPLQGNGGSTWTHAILPDSPALDAGNPATPGSGGHACAATDQREVLRPQGVACDMGAFELEQPPVVHFTASDYDVAEDAGTVTITVTLTAASNLTATVTYTTASGTALAGSDYTSATGILTFAPGTLTQTITVMLTDDALEEEDETFSLTLSAPVNAFLGTPASATVTIVDNEEVPEFKVYLPLLLK